MNKEGSVLRGGRSIWVMVAVLVAIVLAIPQGCSELRAQFEYKQLYDWVYRPPHYARKLGLLVGYYVTPFTQYDPVRKRTIVSCDAYDVHYTTDEGRTWTAMFDTLMWFLDLGNAMQINRSGTYIWYSTIYYPSNYMNILSEDGGRTWRMAIVDTLAGPFGTRDEIPGIVVEPSFHVYPGYRPRMNPPPPEVMGAWVTADNGRTFRRIPFHNRTSSQYILHSPMDSVITYMFGSTHYVAHVLRDSIFRQWNIPGLHIENDWYVMADSSLVGFRGANTYHGVRPSAGVNQYRQLPHVNGIDTVAFSTTHVVRVSDSLVLALGSAGGVAAYRAGWAMPRVLRANDPGVPLEYVVTYGYNDTVLVMTYGLRGAQPWQRATNVVVHLKTLAVHVYHSDGPTQSIGMGGSGLRVVAPLSPTSWVLLSQHQLGMMKITRDAARTWQLLDIPNRIDFLPITHGGVRQIIPTASGHVMLRTAANAVLVPTDSGYNMAIESAFSWNKRRWRLIGLESVVPGEQLDARGEAFEPSVRTVYGDQPVVLYDDTSFVTTGGALLRWSNDGRFLDTVFRRETTHFNRLDNGVWVVGGDSTWFSFNRGREWVYVSRAFPHRLGRDVGGWATAPVSASIAANDGSILLGRRGMKKIHRQVYTDSIYGGLLRSPDLGNTWWQDTTVNHRYAVLSLAKSRTGTVFCLSTEIVHEPEGKTDAMGNPTHAWWYARTFVHRSTDHGRTWSLVLTLPYRPAIPQAEPTIYVADDVVYCIQPSAGVFRSFDDGQRWTMMEIVSLHAKTNINDIYQPGDGYLYFATDSGYARVHLDHVVHAPVKQVTGEAGIASMTYVPTTNELVVDVRGSSDAEVVLCDMHGRYVYQASHSALQRHSLPLLPTGSYIAAVRTAHGVTSMPLVIVR